MIMQKWHPALSTMLLLATGIVQAQAPQDDTVRLLADFKNHSGVNLVFNRDGLPAGVYHDLMVTLPGSRRAAALKIVLHETRKFPPHFFQDIGIHAIGVFDSCASRHGDGFRRFDKQLGGYRYFGIYNGTDAIAAAYYTDEQLPLTFQHEIFHHIDRATGTAEFEDRRWGQILAGQNLYPAPNLKPADLAALKKVSQGAVLIAAVSEYAEKNPAEDKAETARYFMSALADSLVQVAEQPKLAGSQRILHILSKYRRALDGKGPTVDWFVSLALGRKRDATLPLAKDTRNREALTLTVRLQSYAGGDSRISDDTARRLLQSAEKLASVGIPAASAVALTDAAAAATQQLLRREIDPRDGDRQFVVRGSEDANGVNWTLRSNVIGFGQDAARLAAISATAPETTDRMVRTQLQNLRLLSRFYVFIADRWQVTERTREIFDAARDQFGSALMKINPDVAATINQLDLAGLAETIRPDGTLHALDNPYLKNVDIEIEDPALRRVIRRVQPACVRLGGGSGINILQAGRILTAAHVAQQLHRELTAEFPDGRRYVAVCTAIDDKLDLAICTISTQDRLPFALIAGSSPQKGTLAVCIGQPGTTTPSGEATGYQPFHVSRGAIRGFVGDPLGSQRLGGTKHDAWTYWGHSGSPLFDSQGQVIALHNSWDRATAMRHAVTQQAIAKFLKDCKLETSMAPIDRLED